MKIIKTDNIASSIYEIKNQIKNYGTLNSEKCLVFCEDTITLATELEIAKCLGGGFFNIEVLTFKQYILSKYSKDNLLSEQASIMAIRKIIFNNKENLLCFKNSINAKNLAKTLYELISQLKSSKISPEELYSIVLNDNKLNLTKSLNNKLSDIALIYSEYQKYLFDNKFFDSYDYLSLMPQLVEDDISIKNANVITLGFTSVTRQRLDIFKTLNKNAKTFTAIVIANEKYDYYTNELFKLLSTFDSKITVENSPYTVFDGAKDLQARLYDKSVYKDGYKKIPTNSISVHMHQTVSSEINFLAQDIISKIKRYDIKFRDIAIMVGNLEEYRQTIISTFSRYNIPYYLDTSKLLSEHPVITFICDFLEMIRKNALPKTIKSFVSNSIFCADKLLIDGFCNYLDKFSITRKTFFEPFTYECENLSNYELIRQKVVKCINFIHGAKTSSDYTLAIRKLLKEVDFSNAVKTLSQNLLDMSEDVLCEFNEKIEENLDAVLQEIDNVLFGCEISISEFRNILVSGASATKIGSIPLYNDACFIGECKDIKLKSPEILYAVGINGDIPFTKSDTAVLTDKDLSKLDKFVYIEPKIKIVNQREKENICTSLISFKKELVLSYPVLSLLGSPTQKSEIIKYVLQIFDIKEVNHLAQDKYYDTKKLSQLSSTLTNPDVSVLEVCKLFDDYHNGLDYAKKVVNAVYFALKKCNLTSHIKLLDELLEKKDDISVSKENSAICISKDEISATVLESYFSCPFSNFAKNSLRLKEKETGDMKATETGTLLHAVCEVYVKNLDKVSDKISSDILCDNIISALLEKEEYSHYKQNAKYNYIFTQLQKEAKRVCFEIYLGFQKSGFKPWLLEASFGRYSKIKPITIKTNKGSYLVKGKVDRVDKYNDSIRIIDYKTGSIDSDDNSFYMGKKLQLYLYLNAFVDSEHKPAGAYYFPIKDNFEEDVSTYTMRGKTLNNPDIFEATDKSLSLQEKSEIVSVSFDKSGKVTKKSETLDDKEMQAYLSYALEISKQGIDEINKGFIKPSPYASSSVKTDCDYCQFGGLCGFSEDYGGKCRKAKVKATKDTIVSAINKITKKGDNEEND